MSGPLSRKLRGEAPPPPQAPPPPPPPKPLRQKTVQGWTVVLVNRQEGKIVDAEGREMEFSFDKNSGIMMSLPRKFVLPVINAEAIDALSDLFRELHGRGGNDREALLG